MRTMKLLVISLIFLGSMASSYAKAADDTTEPTETTIVVNSIDAEILTPDQTLTFDFGWDCGGFCQ